MKQPVASSFEASAIQSSLNDYYSGLARELAHQPERQHSVSLRRDEFARLQEDVLGFASGQHVLEIACGIGFWTRRLAPTAASICAIDISAGAIELARREVTAPCVRFKIQDALAIDIVSSATVDAVFAGFFVSHVTHEALPRFFSRLTAQLRAGTKLMFIENEYPERHLRPFASVDVRGDTFELRCLKDGSRHRVLKNYFTDDQLKHAIGSAVRDVEIVRSTYYWSLSYTLP